VDLWRLQEKDHKIQRILLKEKPSLILTLIKKQISSPKLPKIIEIHIAKIH